MGLGVAGIVAPFRAVLFNIDGQWSMTMTSVVVVLVVAVVDTVRYRCCCCR